MDVISSSGWLNPALKAMEMSQMVTQVHTPQDVATYSGCAVCSLSCAAVRCLRVAAVSRSSARYYVSAQNALYMTFLSVSQRHAGDDVSPTTLHP